MIISTSNASTTATITATPASLTQEIGVISDGDYSSKYTTSLTGKLSINFKLKSKQDIDYIAIAGNVSIKDKLTIKALESTDMADSNGESLIDSDGHYLKCIDLVQAYSDNLGQDECRVMVIRLDSINTDDIEVIIEGSGSLSITEIAMGKAYTVPRGEQSGYDRVWATPSTKARNATGLNAAPVNFVYCNFERTATLSVPNNLMSDYESESGWREMLKYTARNTFYVSEDNDKYHGYAGFATRGMSTKAHSQTRLLGVSQLTFNAFSGAMS